MNHSQILSKYKIKLIVITLKIFTFMENLSFLNFLRSPKNTLWNKINISNMKQLYIIKNHVRRAAGRGYSYFHLYMCVCMYLLHASWPNEKRYRPEIWYTRSPRPHLKNGFFVFSKKWLCRVTWIFCVSSWSPC